MVSTAAKIYSGPKARGHSTCVYIKTNTERALEVIKNLNPDLKQSGVTEVLDFLVQSYLDTHPSEVSAFVSKSTQASGQRSIAGGIKRKGRLGLSAGHS